MRALLWIVAMMGALGGAAILVLGAMFSNGAPQQAASAAMGIGAAVIPYVLARSWDEVARKH